jgi:tetratricopeptide (TPR) repeat protein
MAPKFKNRFNSAPAKDPSLKYRELISKIERYMEAGKAPVAVSLATELQLKYPSDAKANLLLSEALVANNDLQAAISYAERAVILAPFHPGTNYFLGRLYITFELYEKAAPLLFESLKKAPNSALLHWALADMYIEMNQGENAIRHYEQALNLPLDEPRKLGIKMLYANALSAVDKHAEAAQQLSEMQNSPGMKSQYLFHQSRDPKFDQLERLEKNIRDELLDEQLNDQASGLLHHALGSVLDRKKDHVGGFNEWEISRSFMKQPFPIDAYVGTVDNIISLYSKEVLEKLTPFGNQSEVPVFVFGMARSGTTLTEQIIAAHKQGAGVGELGRMVRLEEKFFNNYSENKDDQKVFRNAESGELRHNADEYLNLLDKLVTGTPTRIVDKAVSQYISAGFIHACFPKARFIHCNRHPADSFVSAFQNRLHHLYVSNQEHYARYFIGKEKLMAHWRTCFPDQIFDLTYEKLVQDPETIVRELIAFLGLEWDPNCMKFFEQKSTVKTLSLHQVRQPIYTSSIYRWKKYEKHLGPLFAALKEANFEYPEL